MRAGESGTFEFPVHIDARGHVRDSTIVSSSHPAFAEAVRKASKPWHFGTQAGETPVVVPIIFRNASFRPRTMPNPRFNALWMSRARMSWATPAALISSRLWGRGPGQLAF